MIGAEPDGLNINDGFGSTHLDHLQRGRGRRTAPTSASPTTATPTAASRSTRTGDDRRRRPDHGDPRRWRMRERGALADDTLVATVMSNLGLLQAMERERHHRACRPRSATATCSRRCAPAASPSAASSPATSSCSSTPPPATACSPGCMLAARMAEHRPHARRARLGDDRLPAGARSTSRASTRPGVDDDEACSRGGRRGGAASSATPGGCCCARPAPSRWCGSWSRRRPGRAGPGASPTGSRRRPGAPRPLGDAAPAPRAVRRRWARGRAVVGGTWQPRPSPMRSLPVPHESVHRVLYTTAASAKGGRGGHVRSEDGVVDLASASPAELEPQGQSRDTVREGVGLVLQQRAAPPPGPKTAGADVRGSVSRRADVRQDGDRRRAGGDAPRPDPRRRRADTAQQLADERTRSAPTPRPPEATSTSRHAWRDVMTKGLTTMVVSPFVIGGGRGREDVPRESGVPATSGGRRPRPERRGSPRRGRRCRRTSSDDPGLPVGQVVDQPDDGAPPSTASASTRERSTSSPVCRTCSVSISSVPTRPAWRAASTLGVTRSTRSRR